MEDLKKINKLIIPNATAFIASFCIMVIELIAGRIVARYLGASLYTWTSVIGIVLIGIAAGSYLGGRLADRFNPRRILSIFFLSASLTCMLVPALNRLAGEFYLFWLLAWPLRITLHVICVFLLPSMMLGIIGPVITKLALDMGWPTGRTVGNIYASSAIGSIAGTFVTGFFLIPLFGTLSIVWSLAVILILMSVFFFFKIRMSLPFFVPVLLLLMFASLGIQKFTHAFAEQQGLTPRPGPLAVYQKESIYSYIEVRASGVPGVRKLILDQLLHSVVNIKDPADIDSTDQYPYIKLYGSLTRHLAGDKKRLDVLIMGGGGYVLPRYIEKGWPGSRMDVVEIDPAVTEAAVRHLGLSLKSSFGIHHMDARHYVNEFIRLKHHGQKVDSLDFIFCDAVSGLSVPYQLTTDEFNKNLRELLEADGVYIVTVIDNFHSGKFIGSVINTLEKTFPFVYVFSTEMLNDSAYARNTFSVVASLVQKDFTDLRIQNFDWSLLTEAQVKILKERSKGTVLTDDYAPVDNLLEPVAYQRGLEMAGTHLTEIGNRLAKDKRLYAAKDYYLKALRVYPDFPIALNNIGNVYLQLGKDEEALRSFKQAIRIAPTFAESYGNIAAAYTQEGDLTQAVAFFMKALEKNPDMAELHYNFGIVLLKQKKLEESAEEFRKALKLKPELIEAYNNLGHIATALGDIQEAMRCYQEAIKLSPGFAPAYNNLGALLAQQGRLDEAIQQFRLALTYEPGYKKAAQNLEFALSANNRNVLHEEKTKP